MHPSIEYPGKLAPVLDLLTEPIHATKLRDPGRTANDNEVSLAQGWRLDAGDYRDHPHLPTLQDDLSRFMTNVMDQPPESSSRDAGHVIRLVKSPVEAAPASGAYEAFAIETTAQGTLITAPDFAGIRRAIYWLEDDMQMRRAPILPIEKIHRWTTYRTRIIRNPLAPYRWLSGWELEQPDRDFYPDAYLQQLSHSGVNGLWVPGLFRNLVPSRVIPELGPVQPKLDKLNELIDRAAKYGVDIFMFIIEPRALSPEHPALFSQPDIVGTDRCMCTSQPRVIEYLREVTQRLFTEAPGLAGLINIPCGERMTSCWSNAEYGRRCPRCSQHPREKILGQTLNAFVDGMKAVKPDGQFIAWTYLMDKNRETAPIDPMLDVMKAASRDVIWMGNFEHGSKKEVFGRKITLHEYSLSCVGPSDYFMQMVKAAREHDLQMYAKMQIGTSYELSSLPYVPVPGIVHDKLERGDEDGVGGAMLGWIPGGFPGPLLKIVSMAAFVPRDDKQAMLTRLAAMDWGMDRAGDVVKAWDIFAEAWQCYPFGIGVLYWGPITRAAAYQLHLEKETRLAKPYNWGTNRNREEQPWEDDMKRWLGDHYTWQEVARAYRYIADEWQKGLDILQPLVKADEGNRQLSRQYAIAKAVQLQCLAAANVYEFYGLRDTLLSADEATQKQTAARMHEVAQAELQHTRDMLAMMAIEPVIGYQSEIFDYSFSQPLLEDKVYQLTDLLPTLARWSRDGIEPAILKRTIEEAQWIRPDTIPERWGD